METLGVSLPPLLVVDLFNYKSKSFIISLHSYDEKREPFMMRKFECQT